jgi:hypothetical protein
MLLCFDLEANQPEPIHYLIVYPPPDSYQPGVERIPPLAAARDISL